ncbi:hypothetical protein Py04_0498 [Pyrococcus sp. ST04]|nr:hypothetical protein Py04_0498 [Pyrococcus sp. ST04]
MRPKGEVSFNLEALEGVEPLELQFFKPPRKAIRLRFSGGFEVIVTVGRNPLAYDRRNLINFVTSLYSFLLNGAIARVDGGVGVLKVVGDELAVIRDGRVEKITRDKKVEGEVKDRVEEFLTLMEFLNEGEES